MTKKKKKKIWAIRKQRMIRVPLFQLQNLVWLTEKEKEQEIEPTQAPTATPTPVEFDRASLSVQVLNGSGVSGEAGRMETYLSDLGYENTEIGNADNSDYQDITI